MHIYINGTSLCHCDLALILTAPSGLVESSHLDPTNPYSAAKAGAEMLCKAYITSYKMVSVGGCSFGGSNRANSEPPIPPLCFPPPFPYDPFPTPFPNVCAQPIIITRGNNVYGPHQFPEKMIPKFTILASRGKDLPLHGDGSAIRSYLYVEDVAEAFDCVLHKGEVGGIYNVGTDKERSVADVARDIAKYFALPEAKIIMVKDRAFNDK